jgi:hypothetical protein
LVEGGNKNPKKSDKTMGRLTRRTFLSFLSLVFTAGCGGGGAGGDTKKSAGAIHTNIPPQDTGNKDPLLDPPPPDPPQTDPPAEGNVIGRENAKTEGVSAQWYIEDHDYASRQEIEGYASATSVNRGESIMLYVNTIDPTYTISVYRVGWYGGAGGRLVAGPVTRNGFRQPVPPCDSATNLVECDWTDPYVLHIPASPSDPTDWASGVYLAKLVGSSGKQSYIIFVVRDDARAGALLFQASVTTYAAYNNWGGHSYYDVDCVDRKPAYKVSFNRPYRNPQRPSDGKGAGDFLSWEINMLRFLEREGYDVVYATNIDTHVAPNSLRRHRGFLSVGHDEYWTRSMRDAMEAARDHGVNLGFIGANAGYWQVRLEPSGTGQPNRTVVGYKYYAMELDPVYLTDPASSTLLWRDYPVSRPEASLIGVQYDYNSVDLDMVMYDCSSWICAGTGLRNGAVLTGMLGYEVDRVDPVSSPAGIRILASSPYEACLDDTCSMRETRYAHMTCYSASSGAVVFATGSMQWTWGLDDFGPWGDRVQAAVQQMTRNVLNRFVG